jgi:hypothetical protein
MYLPHLLGTNKECATSCRGRETPGWGLRKNFQHKQPLSFEEKTATSGPQLAPISQQSTHGAPVLTHLHLQTRLSKP